MIPTGINNKSACLLPFQLYALEYIHDVAAQQRTDARNTLNTILSRAGLEESDYAEALQSVSAHARVGVHFHPERICGTGQSVAQGLLAAGIYKNQFETGISSGSPTAYAGGDRDQWERNLFGGAYHAIDILNMDRPKYGALEIMYHPDGAAPRFGSCYFLLLTEVSQRSTFTFCGSQEELALTQTGTLEVIEPVLAALCTSIENGQGALGVDNLTVSDLFKQLKHGLCQPFRDPSLRPMGRALDSFIEAQIHGPINLLEDVETLVADPSFRESPIEELLQAISTRYDIPLYWHAGFTLSVSEVPDSFRGFAVKPLACRIADHGILDAAKIGIAANSLQQEPELWQDWGAYRDTLTQFRRLWHVLVLYGVPKPADNQRPAINANCSA